jgi:hypothetical protein
MARMTGRHASLIGGVVAFVAAGVWFFGSRSQDHLIVDLMTEFPNAKKQPRPDAFTASDATLQHVTQPAALASGSSRLTFQHVSVPENAWLRVSLGIREDGWKTPGDGVLFFVIISDGRQADQVLSRQMNPYAVGADRGWRDERIDLSEYAGETIDVILNTRAGADPNDAPALWGSPRIVVR